MSCETHDCVLTRGEFYIADWAGSCVGGLSEILCMGTPRAFKKIGNVSSCLVNIAAQVLGRENEFNPLDDTCARTQVASVGLTININSASRANLMRALYALEQEPDEGSQVQDYCIASLDECDFFPFDKKYADPDSVVVYLRDAMGAVTATLVVDVDYKISKSGIEILQTITLGTAVTLRLTYDWDNANYYEMDFLTKYCGYKTLYFKGVNYGDSEGGENLLFDAVFNKVLFSPVDQFDLIGRDEFLTLTLTGSVEKDAGSWFKITKQEE